MAEADQRAASKEMVEATNRRAKHRGMVAKARSKNYRKYQEYARNIDRREKTEIKKYWEKGIVPKSRQRGDDERRKAKADAQREYEREWEEYVRGGDEGWADSNGHAKNSKKDKPDPAEKDKDLWSQIRDIPRQIENSLAKALERKKPGNVGLGRYRGLANKRLGRYRKPK